MATDLEFIQTFSPLFSHFGRNENKRSIKNPLGATAYYIFLIKMFPTNFTSIGREATQAMGTNVNDNKLQRGKQELLDLGFISRILPVYDKKTDLNFDRETFLPISPELVWQDNVVNLIGKLPPESLEKRLKIVEKLQDIYAANFGRYGVYVESGSITVFHSSRWLLYHLAYNINYNRNIRMLLGSLGSFEGPGINYYKKMLESGLKTKIICDPVSLEAKKRINNIMKLKQYYDENIEIRATNFTYGTSRRIIYDNMAIDGKKLAYHGDLTYISTIYFDEDIITRMRNNFDIAFEMSRELLL